MKMLYTHENPAMVGYAKSVAEDAGIEVVLRNQYGAAGMAPPYTLWEELWLVHDEDYDRAMELLGPIIGAGEDEA